MNISFNDVMRASSSRSSSFVSTISLAFIVIILRRSFVIFNYHVGERGYSLDSMQNKTGARAKISRVALELGVALGKFRCWYKTYDHLVLILAERIIEANL